MLENVDQTGLPTKYERPKTLKIGQFQVQIKFFA